MPLADGQAFAGYTIVRIIGAGAMGEVYLAEHPRLPRQDALKVLSPAVSADDEYRRRFLLEAEMASELRHPHSICQRQPPSCIVTYRKYCRKWQEKTESKASVMLRLMMVERDK